MISRPKQIFFMALATGLAAALLQWVILREGIRCNPDGWSYWQGSVTLMNGEGYRLFSGSAIVDWPPLYSWYLALWQSVFGVSGATVLASTVVSTGISAALWGVMLRLTMKPATELTYRWSDLFVAVTFALATRHLMSESLTNMILPGLLGFAMHAAMASGVRRYLSASAGAAVFGGLLLLTRHASIAFLCAAIVLLVSNREHGWGLRLRACMIFGAIALAPALICEAMLPAVASRTIELGIAKFGPIDYLMQAAQGIGDRLLGSWFGFAAWLFAVWVGLSARTVEPLRRTFGFYLVFAITSALVLYVLFNVTFINTELRGRILFFVPLVTMGAVLVLVPTLPHRGLRITMLVLLLGLPIAKSIKYAIKGRAAHASLSDVAVLADNFIRPHFTIELDHVGKAPVWRSDGRLLVSPPDFPTHDAIMRAHRNAKK